MNDISRDYVIYNSDGRILRSITCAPRMIKLQKKANEFVLEGFGEPNTHYVVGRTILDRPDNPTVVTGTTLTNVPIPSTLHIGPDMYELTDPTVALDLPLAGKYYMWIESFPYKNLNIEVTV